MVLTRKHSEASCGKAVMPQSKGYCKLITAIFFIPELYEYKELMFVGAFKLFFNYLLVEWLYKGLEYFKFITIRTLIVKVIYVVSVFVFVRKANDYFVYYLLLRGLL